MTPCQTISVLGVDLWVKREDLNHPIIQGNKSRKLKYNLQLAQQQRQTVVTFGGAYSNHLLAAAFACQTAGLRVIGVVRGDELHGNPLAWSETLFQCQEFGMQLVFVSRSDYRKKQHSEKVKQLLNSLGNYMLIPEGGSNALAVKGMAELVTELSQQMEPPSHIICPVGTGATLAGLIQGAHDIGWHCQVYGIAVLKGLHGVNSEINQWLKSENPPTNWDILNDYHCGGYAKSTPELERFALTFAQKHGFSLDKIYNAKSFFAVAQMIKKGEITENDRPIIINTGGTQGGVF